MKKLVLACALGTAVFTGATCAQVYDVEVLPSNDIAENVFAQSIDETGNVSVVTQGLYNQTINLQLLNFDDPIFTSLLTDVDAARTGNFNETDYLTIIQGIRLNTQGNSAVSQKLAIFRSFQFDGQTNQEIPAFDEVSQQTNGLTQSNEVIVRDSEAGLFFVGSSADVFESLVFTNQQAVRTNFVINDFRNLAFVQVGDQARALLPPDQTLGGFSDAYAINNALQVAGSGTVDVNALVDFAVQNCADPATRGDIPEAFCQWRLQYPTGGVNQDGSPIPSIISATGGNTEVRAIIWSIDGNGNVVDIEVFPLAGEDSTQPLRGFAEARDINDNGVAVGFSGRGGVRQAASFSNAQTELILPSDEFPVSQAFAINNNNNVTGTIVEVIENRAINRMFVTNLETQEVVLPSGFFSTSTTLPRDMNNQDLVVGQGEVVSSVSNGNDRQAFIYDINSQEFTNLNTLIECDSPFTLVNAVAINDNGEIAVTARASVPVRNARGEDILDQTGARTFRDGVVALKLRPIPNGQPANCREDNSNFERQGASVPLSSLIALFLLFGIKRLKRKWN